MNTEDLIGRLVRDARPVTRAPGPLVLFALWSVTALLVIAVGCMAIGPRDDIPELLHQPAFMSHTLFVLSVTALAAAAAFRTSIPDREQRLLIAILAVALTMWLGWLVTAGMTASVPVVGYGWKCLRNIGVLAIPLGALAYYLISRAAPLRTGTVGMLAALSAAAAADLATRFICRNDHAFHSLIWHFGTVLVLGGSGVILGRRLFRWDAADRSPNATPRASIAPP